MTHYDTLGVARDASDAELRSAYRARARQFHPDLRGDRTPTEGTDGDRAMQRLNNAWHVISGPDRRRRYDQSLDEFRAGVRPGEPATDDRPAYAEQPTGPGRVLPVVALLVAVVVCTIAAAFVLHQTSSRTATEGVDAVTAGDCVTVRSGHISEIVPCDSPNDGRVVSEIPRGQQCATATDRLVDGRSGSTFVCLDTTGHP